VGRSASAVLSISLLIIGGGALGCADASKPPTSPKTDEGNDPVTGRPATSFKFAPVDRIASPTDPKSGQSILVDQSGACYVESPPGGKTALECPPELKAPEWAKKCADKLVNQRGDSCQCEVFADPPYVGRVPCPKH
jgi:hypothetical protein